MASVFSYHCRTFFVFDYKMYNDAIVWWLCYIVYCGCNSYYITPARIVCTYSYLLIFYCPVICTLWKSSYTMYWIVLYAPPHPMPLTGPVRYYQINKNMWCSGEPGRRALGHRDRTARCYRWKAHVSSHALQPMEAAPGALPRSVPSIGANGAKLRDEDSRRRLPHTSRCGRSQGEKQTNELKNADVSLMAKDVLR